MKVEQKCGIISRTMLNDAAISLTLEVGDMVRTAFRAPGQFVHIKCGHSRLLRRPISVCACQAGEGDAPDRLTVVFEVRGEGTAWLAGRREGQSLDVMGLLGNGFPMKREGRYLLVGGGHIPKRISRRIRRVSEQSEENLREAIELGEITGESFGHKPRIAVAALNPHCGEFGLCGREEVDVIKPTIEKVVKETGWNVSGPYSADTLFISALAGDFDVVVTMYHDQGQIALKLVGFQRCITVAGGQPYPIATCAHGTAFDKVGKATATTDSFERAVKAVSRMAIAKRAKKA